MRSEHVFNVSKVLRTIVFLAEGGRVLHDRGMVTQHEKSLIQVSVCRTNIFSLQTTKLFSDRDVCEKVDMLT